MEGPISFWGYKEQESNLILPEHDDDDDISDYEDISLIHISLIALIIFSVGGKIMNISLYFHKSTEAFSHLCRASVYTYIHTYTYVLLIHRTATAAVGYETRHLT